jgi:hypothetical protein
MTTLLTRAFERVSKDFGRARPGQAQRTALLTRLLAGTKLQPGDIEELAAATGSTVGRNYGYTYSDLRQRLVPEIALTAYRRGVAVEMAIALEVTARTRPTRPFELMGR